MIKGAVILKPYKTKRWVRMYEIWFNGKHDTMIVHCPDEKTLKRARHAAIKYRESRRLNGRFSISIYNGDLYLMRIGDQKYAMEVWQDDTGWIFYYDTEKELENND